MIPKPYQLKAIDSLESGSILCGGVGSGKSFTALLYFWTKELDGVYDGVHIKRPSIIKDLYIITTARKRDTFEWEKELASFEMGVTESFINVIIDSWNNIAKYVDVKDAFFIFDEQRVIGSGTWAKSFIKISKNNRWILLSATPGDTWMDYIPVFIANGYYKNRTAFLKEHVVFDYYSRYPKVKMYINEKKLIFIRNKILINMDYAKPTKRHHKWIKCNYDVNLYFRVWKQRWNVYKDKPIENSSELFACLRNVVNSDSSRMDILTQVIEYHKKVIVFYNFDTELYALRQYCEDNDILYKEWNGHHHQMLPESDVWVYLVQYNAGSEGWNCVETDTVLFWSLNYSYKTLEQSCGRIDRLNTPFQDLYYYHLYSPSQIDKSIKAAIDKKETFSESAFLAAQQKHVT